MENTLLIGLSRQIALQRELDVVANNIANLNTTGYKADGSVFQEFLMPTASGGTFVPGSRPSSYVQDRATWHNFSPGPIRPTGNPLDIAIDGDAFLVVQTARGERYTRNGALQINNAGELVTATGDRVLGEGGPIQFQTNDNNIVINNDGTITVREGANATSDSTRGKLRLVRFAEMQSLIKEGSNLFRAPNGVQPQPATTGVRILQGSVEQSNVHGVVEMARMLELTRAYTQIAAMLQQTGDQQNTAIDRLAEVPA